MNTRLKKQIDFIYTLEKMKAIERKTHLIYADRFENDAEHSFHIAAMALILKEYAPKNIDLERVISMLLFHDVVEIEAGDTFAYDEALNQSKRVRETRAAEMLYGALPEDQGEAFRALWDEFEAQETLESRFALAMDRMEPILLNAAGCGGSWKYHHVKREDVLQRIEPLREFAPLYEVVLQIVDNFFLNEEVSCDEGFADRR